MDRRIITALTAAICFAGAEKTASANSRFVNISVQQVIDNQTHLIWQTQPSDEKFTYTQAELSCEKLELENQPNWRLPHIKELASLVDDLSYNPSIYPYFKTKPYFYWTATANAADDNYAWLVNFSDSHIHSFHKGVEFHARCVRDAEPQ